MIAFNYLYSFGCDIIPDKIGVFCGNKETKKSVFLRRKRKGLGAENRLKTFEQAILPHLASAYNLARWLTRSEQDAEDLVQEAFLRAFQFFDGFRGENGRVWLLTIVRNTCYTWRKRTRGVVL